ncbi:unnamed protein product [Heligmosomoides polygyrus]|uniref:Cytochrome b5 heme-binding domain-containing protein n=1 Tax=Heligmosomoides polygyrus TaxID=6339 RepID=A0A3P8B3X8_HELPZ|nr:unnamed protein product [Heligmosomoides polygyrus]
MAGQDWELQGDAESKSPSKEDHGGRMVDKFLKSGEIITAETKLNGVGYETLPHPAHSPEAGFINDLRTLTENCKRKAHITELIKRMVKYYCGRKATFGNSYASFIYGVNIVGYVVGFALTTVSYFKTKYWMDSS